MSRPDETNYDPALPGRIRRELGVEAPEPAAAPPPPPSPRRRLLIGLGAVAGAGMLALLLFSLTRGDAPRTGREAALAAARGHLAERDWAGICADLKSLREEGSLGEEGRRLDDTARGMLGLDSAEREGDWVAAYDAALDLDRVWKEEGAVRAEISRRLDRARTEVLAGRKLAEGRDHLGAGEPARALEAFGGVPEGTACAATARAEAGKARALLRSRGLAEAEKAADAGRWEKAREALEGLGPLEDEASQALARRVAVGLAQAEALGKAEALLAALRVPEAREALEAVDPEGPCAKARADLAKRLDRAEACARRVAEARARFDRGEGEEALALLARADAGPVPAELRQGIAGALGAYQHALEALDRGDDLGALAGVRRLCAMPLAEGNWYRGRAEAARDLLDRKVKARAEVDVAAGVSAFQKGRYREAGEAFAKALRAAPGHPVAAFYCQKRLPEVGKDLYLKGYVLRAMDPAAARVRFEEALACLPEGDPTAAKAREALR